MTTAVNKCGLCGGMCTAVPTSQKEKEEIDKERREEVTKFHKKHME